MPKLTDFVDWMEAGYVYLFCTVLRFNKISSKGFIRIQFCWCLKKNEVKVSSQVNIMRGAQRWDLPVYKTLDSLPWL